MEAVAVKELGMVVGESGAVLLAFVLLAVAIGITLLLSTKANTPDTD